MSTKNTSLGRVLGQYKYPITTPYYYLSWSGIAPNLGGNKKWATWSNQKDNEIHITSEGYLRGKEGTLYLSWSCIRAPNNLCPERKWAVWSPNKDTPVEITQDGYLKMKTENLYLSWSGYRRGNLDVTNNRYRLSAVWSPSKDTPISKIC